MVSQGVTPLSPLLLLVLSILFLVGYVNHVFRGLWANVVFGLPREDSEKNPCPPKRKGIIITSTKPAIRVRTLQSKGGRFEDP